MRPLELKFNALAADLPATTKGLIRFQQARIVLADVDIRQGEYSFKLTLPATQQNARIFGVNKLHAQGLNKFGYYSDFPYELRCEGEIFSGSFRLTSLKGGYTGTLMGVGFSWALLLGQNKLTDLVFPTVPYDGSQLERIQVLNCDSTDLQFPLVAWGNFFAPPITEIQADGSSQEVPAPAAAVLDYPLSVDDCPPGVYYVNVLRQIFASIGWQLQGRELDSEFWRAVVMLPAGADTNSAWPWGSLLLARQAGTASAFSYYDDRVGNYSNSNGGFWDEQNGEVFFLPLASLVRDSPTRALDGPAATFTAPRSGVYRFKWKATLVSGHQSWDYTTLTADLLNYMRPVGLGLVVRRGGQDWTEADGGLVARAFTLPLPPAGYDAGQDRVLTGTRIDDPANADPQALAIGTTYASQTGDVYLEAGDAVRLCTFARRRLLSNDYRTLITRREFVTEWTDVEFSCIHYEDDNGLSRTAIQPSAFLPPLLQKEVIKDFLVRVDGFILTDPGRQIATIVSRAELSQAGGEPIDLTDRCDPSTVEYQPAAGAGVGSFVFSPAALSDDALVPETADIVSAPIGPGDSQKAITSQFAPVGSRLVQVRRPADATYVLTAHASQLPTCASTDTLATARSESEQRPSDQTPRLLRYLGPDATRLVPFAQRAVPLGRAVWDGPLAWDGDKGAVGTYYADTLRRALFGHLTRVTLPLNPALYAALQPGKRVLLGGVLHTMADLQNFDVADEAALVTLDLDREIL